MVWRAERRGAREQEILPRWEIDTRPGPDPYKDGPEWPRTDIRMPRTSPWGPERRTPPSNTEPCSRRFGMGLQNAILAFQPPWYKFEMP